MNPRMFEFAASTIRVNLPSDSYEIAIAPGSLDSLGNALAKLEVGKKVMVVSNPAIFRHYGEKAIASLTAQGFDVSTHLFPPGERYKTLSSIQKLYDNALNQRLERSSTLIALGGGVVGDMTGFAAATWLRGMHFVQVPTTLLAAVDASIGGKTGVNHPQGKNLIGAFYQPRLVLIDPEVFKTLPAREFRAGMAEVIKYGVIWDTDLFAQLEATKRLDQLRYLPTPLLQTILTRSCQAKAEVVSQDEKEAGLRAILNYGHTIGHVIESLTGYKLVNHGEAVAIGMVAAGALAVHLKLWEQTEQKRQIQLLEKTGLPVTIPVSVNVEPAIAALQTDKKVKGGQVRFVLPTQIGKVTLTDQVPTDLIRQIWQELSVKSA